MFITEDSSPGPLIPLLEEETHVSVMHSLKKLYHFEDVVGNYVEAEMMEVSATDVKEVEEYKLLDDNNQLPEDEEFVVGNDRKLSDSMLILHCLRNLKQPETENREDRQ